MFYVCNRLPRTAWIHPNIALEVLFPDVLGLANTPYSSSIRDFLNLWPINSNLWSCGISIGLVSRVNIMTGVLNVLAQSKFRGYQFTMIPSLQKECATAKLKAFHCWYNVWGVQYHISYRWWVKTDRNCYSAKKCFEIYILDFLYRLYAYMVENCKLCHNFSMTSTGVLIFSGWFKIELLFLEDSNMYMYIISGQYFHNFTVSSMPKSTPCELSFAKHLLSAHNRVRTSHPRRSRSTPVP